jgi:hypothetical protein
MATEGRYVPVFVFYSYTLLGISEPPHCWTVILPQYTLSRHVEVLIATAATIIVVDGQDAVDQVRNICATMPTFNNSDMAY